MQLLYIWIKKYTCLENANLNFCENFRFSYNDKNNKLIVTQDKQNNASLFPLKINNFTEDSCIDNISVIVGSNGAGKTSICRFLYTLYFYHNNIPGYIIIYKIDNTIYITSDLNPDISDLNKILDSNTLFDLNKLQIQKKSLEEHCSFNMLFYSPIYNDKHPFQTPIETYADVNSLFKDVSTTYTLNHDIEIYKNKTTGVEYTDNINEFTAHRILDNNRIATFISYFLHIETNIELGITLPKFVYFTYDENAITLFDQECNVNNIENLILNELSPKINQSNKKEFFIDKLSLVIYCTFCRTFTLNQKFGYGEILQKEYKNILSEYNYKNNDKSVSQHVLDILSLCSNEIFKEGGLWINFINQIKNLDEKHFESGYLKLNLKTEAKLFCFLNALYQRISYIYDFGEFEFNPTLSSGEYSELLIYSRLLYGISEIAESNKNKEFLLFLDETEITLHPGLQQHLIKNLIKFLNDIYLDQGYKFQIILATHSPIVLSDLPKDNVVFLQKIPGKTKSIVKELPENKNTFAASIYELYKDSFFVDNTTTGTFAKEIINYALKSKKNDFKNYIINLIGDKLLKALIIGENNNDSDSKTRR